jgi:hypothetical protein
MRFAGANPAARLSAGPVLPGKSHYFTGTNARTWKTGVPHHSRVIYYGVYPGIDLLFYGNQRQLEYDFILSPGADPDQIVLSFEGSMGFRLDKRGDLVVRTEVGEIRFRKPQVYQEVKGVRHSVPGGYVRRGRRGVGFRLGHYDRALSLTIDPILSYSTYLGTSGDEQVRAIALDSSGSVYLAGVTSSPAFPHGGSGYAGGVLDAFVTKLDRSGSSIVYSVFIGGSGDDRPQSISLDSSRNAHVAGWTSSLNFPVAGAFQPTYGGGLYDGFLVKINADGDALLYSTYIGGSSDDRCNGVAVDSLGMSYVTGFTDSGDFPGSSGAYQTAKGGGIDAFLAKYNPATTGSASRVYATYLGGPSNDFSSSVAVDGAHSAYIVGQSTGGYSTTPGSFQSNYGGGAFDAFVTKLNPAGSALAYSTYLGGSNQEAPGGQIRVDTGGNAYVTGWVQSIDFPVTPGAAQTSFAGGTCSSGGCGDAFLTKLNPTGSGLVYSTYLGGSGDENPVGLDIDSDGTAYITGVTNSPNFPLRNPIQSVLAGPPCPYPCGDAFLSVLSNQGASLLFSTYLGGSGSDFGLGVAVDSARRAYLAGQTSSANFPTSSALQPSYAGGPCAVACGDGFVSKIGEPQINQSYACFNCISTGEQHTGVDLFDETLGQWQFSTPVRALQHGIIINIYRVANQTESENGDPYNRSAWCDGTTAYFNEIPFENHGFGNVVILQYNDGKFGLYAHLDCIEREMVERFRQKNGKTPLVSQGEKMGVLGNSYKSPASRGPVYGDRHARRYCNSDPNRLPPGFESCESALAAGICTRCDESDNQGFSPHLHLEKKLKGVLANPYEYRGSEFRSFGYTRFHPDNYGYLNPLVPTATRIAPASGPAGTVVTLSGRHFAGGDSGQQRPDQQGPTSKVWFGGVAATVNSWSDTQVVVVAPAGSGAVDVVVETSGGLSNTMRFSYGP